MKNMIKKLAIAWIAILGLIGISKDRTARNEEHDNANKQQQEVKLDEYELASFHNS